MTTPNKSIPYVPQGVIDPAAAINQSLNFIDALLQCAVIDMSLTAPPMSPQDGDLYIVAGLGGSATGAWAGKEDYLARYVDEGNSWQFFEPGSEVAIVVNRDNGSLYVYEEGSGGGWALYAVATSVQPIVIQLSASDLTSDLAVLPNVAYCRAPQAMTLVDVRASLIDASSSGDVTVDVNVNSSTILNTKVTIDEGELTSVTSDDPPVISDPDIADDDLITIDIDAAGTDARGLIVTLIGAVP